MANNRKGLVCVMTFSLSLSLCTAFSLLCHIPGVLILKKQPHKANRRGNGTHIECFFFFLGKISHYSYYWVTLFSFAKDK
jgi:hypothetical protein